MESSASAPSKPVDDDLKLDELVSELHSLKKLYGILQNNRVRPSGPVLDEKSSNLLKKLLDGATQQALQSQAKIISCTHETPKLQAEITNNNFQNEVRETQKTQEYNPTVPPESSPEAAISTPVAQPKPTENLSLMPEPSTPMHRRCKDATVHRCGAIDFNRSLPSRPSESANRRKSSPQSKGLFERALQIDSASKCGQESNLCQQDSLKAAAKPNSQRAQLRQPNPKNDSRHIASTGIVASERPPSSEKAGDLLALVPVQKRPRVEPIDPPSRVSSRTRKPDRVDRQLTHQKKTSRKPLDAEPNSSKSMLRTRSSKHPSSTSITLIGDHQMVPNAQTPDRKTRTTSYKHIKPDRLNRPKAKKSSPSLKKDSTQYSSSNSTSSTGSIHQKKNQSLQTKNRPKKPIKPARPNRSKTQRYSSSFSTSSSTTRPPRLNLFTPKKQSKAKTREGRKNSKQVSPKSRIIPHQLALKKTHIAPKQEKNDEQGRFKKLTNKLAIIFHHQHHHHHHIHTRQNEGKDHEKSLWKYLKGVVHVRKKRGDVHGKLHGHNLRVMMEWFLSHLWWMRQRKRRKKVDRRRLGKKVKWWEWFRRKRGVAVGGRRRLRLGFNGSHRRSGGGKG